MSASSEQGPRLRCLAYESTTEPVTACPHCGARIHPPPRLPARAVTAWPPARCRWSLQAAGKRAKQVGFCLLCSGQEPGAVLA
jgi:hypothetical protein